MTLSIVVGSALLGTLVIIGVNFGLNALMSVNSKKEASAVLSAVTLGILAFFIFLIVGSYMFGQ